jgi:hypothetical protein
MSQLLQIHITNEEGEVLDYWWTDEQYDDIVNVITERLATYDSKADYEAANNEEDEAIFPEEIEPDSDSYEELPDDHEGIERGEN